MAPMRSLSANESLENTPNNHFCAPPRLVLKPRSQIRMAGRAHDAKRQRILLPGPDNQKDLEAQIYINGSYTTAADSQLDHRWDTPAPCIYNRGHNSSAALLSTFPRTVDLSPCHICHQKPKVRTDLDSYGDCEGCGKRTCFI